MTRKRSYPGYELWMPASDKLTYDGYYNTSPECWSVYTEVLAAEFNDAVLFGRIHQLTVDSYAVQHAGGPHPDKSIDVHLAGLHLVLERGARPADTTRLLKRLADSVVEWPHFPRPGQQGALTVLDVALADSAEDHMRIVSEWSRAMWNNWSQYHRAVANFVGRHLR